MCEPATIAVIAGSVAVAASAASAGLSISGQQQQRKSAVAYQNLQVQANDRQMKENRELATKAYLDQANAANLNLAQTREATAATNQEQGTKSAEARSATMAAAAEGGVSGLSLNALLGDFHRQEDMFLTRNEQNLLFKQQQTATQTQGFQDTAAGRIAQVKPFIPGPIAPVDYFTPALSIVGSAGESYLKTDGWGMGLKKKTT